MEHDLAGPGGAAAASMRAMILVNGEEYLAGEEAAGLLGVKRETLYAYVSRGLLRSYRQGIKRQRLYRRSEIEALLRLAPSSPDEAVAPATARAARPAEVPLAESWIRE
jgi:excisionase family DNA binding protein